MNVRLAARILLPRLALICAVALLVVWLFAPDPPHRPARKPTPIARHHKRGHKRGPETWVCHASPGHKLRTGKSEAQIIGHCHRA